MVFVFEALVLALAAVLFYRYRKNRIKYREVFRRFPGPKPLPILGNAIEVLHLKVTDFLAFTCDLFRQYGPNVLLHGPFGEVNLVLSSSDAIKRVLLCKETKKHYIYENMKFAIGTGLAASDGELYDQRRRIIGPTFDFKMMEHFLPVFNHESDRLVEKLNVHLDGKEFNILSYIALNMLDNICETSMGVTINAMDNPDSEYVTAVQDSFRDLLQWTMSAFRFWPANYLYPAYWRLRRQRDIIVHFTNTVLQTRRQLKQQQLRDTPAGSNDSGDADMYGKQRLNFADLLLQESSLRDSDVLDEVVTFLNAAWKSTSIGLYFTILLITLHQDVQQRLYKEITQVLEGDSKRRPLTQACLKRMTYLDMVLKESFRLYTPIPTIGRTLLKDMEIDGVMVPRGTYAVVSIFNLHRNPEVYPDPERFNPERFSEENGTPIGPYDYMPFSTGFRNCPGQRFALLELKVVLVKLLARYKFLPGKSFHSIVVKGDLALRPAEKYQIRIERRNEYCTYPLNPSVACRLLHSLSCNHDLERKHKKIESPADNGYQLQRCSSQCMGYLRSGKLER
ncbi:cytochrome P450 4c21-like [Sabethes cyaneus]|uniref:cytochrome P450 4c21-like n=1 Tax=Sabethes cyaneus TaxID=53552 RepID=UPI00237D3BC6|nr:cytochrome P450 4c21-like [Sabethes cyaneus]